MNKKKTVIRILAIAIDLAVFVSTIVYVVLGLNGYVASENRFGPAAPSYLRYFTTLSNLYAAIVSLFIAVLLIIYFKKDIVFPKWIKLIYASAVTSVMLTFFTVILFLEPTQMAQGRSFFFLYWGMDYLLFHAINPILVLLCYLFSFKGEKLNFKELFFTIIPMVIYSCVYTPCVITHKWPDFYGFTFGGKYYLTAIVLPAMLIATYAISFGINLLVNLLDKKLKK